MILYFADRRFNILGHASTSLPKGLVVVEDLKTEDVETGIATFECIIPFDSKTRESVKQYTKVGNFLLRSHNDENEYFTIIDSEWNEKNKEVTIYAEDAGLDLLNEIVGAYEATEAKPISFYIETFAYDSGFVIGTNEIADLKRKLAWDSADTITSRLVSVATQFDNAEIAYSFEVKGLRVTKKYINIYKKRGQDTGVQLRFNKEIDNIITSESIANTATALRVTGGIPEEEKYPITLDGVTYDDGDIFLEGTYLKSRKAHAVWSRYLSENGTYTGHICRRFEYDTLSKTELLNRAISELKKVREPEVNYKIDITSLPENIRIGDRVNVINDDNDLYVSARILKLETSVANQKQTATIGEYLIKSGGISQKVADLAEQFAKTAASVARAQTIANEANATATAAQGTANEALVNANNATTTATEAKTAATQAQASASDAQSKADAAQAAVGEVEKDVEEIEQTVANAEQAAAQAQQAATSAETKATQAQQASVKAQEDATEAKTKAEEAKSEASSATENASTAKTTADQAKTKAEEAATTAAAAKLDAENAQKDIDSLGEQLTTVENTMKADYARKTDLTETEASLQSQISQNAAQISSTVSRMQTIDETANNASEQAQAAQSAAQAAQAQADQATADATAAQTAANEAAAAATSAQSEADKAKAAASTAQNVADKAKTDLEAAQADLATVQGRVDATEEEIAQAQQAVTQAQQAADKAQSDADEAATKAANAQSVANTASANASNAQTVANEASEKATTAQQVANEAKGNAEDAIATANEAKTNAQNAIATANTAKANAENAQSIADQAAADAEAAQKAADDADAKAQAAQTDLNTAKQNLANVTARVGATEEEVAAAQEAVETAQAAADAAKADAATAQTTANTAKANAATAQTAANNAKTAADNAQKAADDAQDAADNAQADVDALAVRVTNAETSITQNSEQIALRAKKEEVEQALGGYYKKTETEALIKVESDKISAQAAMIDEHGTKISKLEQDANGFSISLETLEADAIVSTVEQFYKSTSATTLSGGSWSASQPTWEQGKYIWRRTLVTYGDGSTVYTPNSTGVCITGNTGATGAKGDTGATGEKGDKGDKGDTGATGSTGATGRGISSIKNKYAVSTSKTNAPSTWYDAVQTMTATNKYLWNYEIITYTDGTTSETAKRVIGVYGDTGAQGAKGDTGDTGATGATGNGISTITEYYLASASSSGVTTSTSGWTTTIQTTTTTKKYLWNYEIITYTNGNKYTSTPIIIGTHGATGAKGDTGAQGEKGDTGTRGTGIYKVTTAPSSYTTATGGFTPTYRIALSTAKSQSGASEILVGDNLRYSYYLYPVGYVDSSYVYLGARNSIRGAQGAKGDNGDKGDKGDNGADGQMLYATCGTAAGTAAKVATLSNGTLSLKVGATVAVKFTYANTVSSPTLNVASTGAKSIRLNGSALTSSAYYWVAGAVVTFVYDGSYWNVSDAAALVKANEASKTASNYMSYDSTNGLLVGNKSSGSWSGFRTQITASAFNILNSAGAVLASYGAKLVELGKNATDAVISFCGGKGKIEFVTDAAEESQEYLQLTGESVRLLADGRAAISSYYFDDVSHQRVARIVADQNKNAIEMYAYESYNVDPDTMNSTGNQGYLRVDTSGVGMDGMEATLSVSDGVNMVAKSINIDGADGGLGSGTYIDGYKPILGASDGNYWGLRTFDGDASYMRTTQNGLLPYSSSSNSYLGTIYWQFQQVCTKNLYINKRNHTENKVLWSGVYYMNANQTATLSESISAQPHGVVLVWDLYENGAAQAKFLTHNFIPKAYISNFPGRGILCNAMSGMYNKASMAKFVYVNDTTITGHSYNSTSATSTPDSVIYDNSLWVLRLVIGV